MKGQTLVESLLALAIISIVIASIAVTVTTALSNANFGKNQSLATQYAQEGIEVLLTMRSKNYSTFGTYSGDYCLGKNAVVLSPGGSCIGPNFDNFIRSINIEQGGCAANVAKVITTVSWKDGKCPAGVFCHSSKVVSCFSTVNPVQSP